MKENYKFLVSLRKKYDSEVKKNITEQEILATSPPHPTPMHTLDKNMDDSLLMDIYKCACRVNLLFCTYSHVHGFSQREFNSVTLSYYNL